MDQDMHVFQQKVCFNLGDTLYTASPMYCKHVISCRFGFKSWFVYSDLGVEMLSSWRVGGNAESLEMIRVKGSPIRVTGGWRGSKQIKQWNLANEPRYWGVGVEEIWLHLRYMYTFCSKAIYTYIVIYRYMHILRCIKAVGLEGMPGAQTTVWSRSSRGFWFGCTSSHPGLQWFFTLTRKKAKKQLRNMF